MSISCTRCGGTGFLNVDQLPTSVDSDDSDSVLVWLEQNPRGDSEPDHDVSVCDCCGDGEKHYGVPGEHYNSDDPKGDDGPYSGNGGLCECH